MDKMVLNCGRVIAELARKPRRWEELRCLNDGEFQGFHTTHHDLIFSVMLAQPPANGVKE